MVWMKAGRNEVAVKWIRVVRAGLLYFAVVFGAGFVLGFFRVVFVVPKIGVRWAELIEVPMMITISYFVARWLIGRLQIPYRLPDRVCIGIIALFLLISAELGLVFWLQKLTLGEYVASRDPISGTAYLISLLLFGIFPLIVRRET